MRRWLVLLFVWLMPFQSAWSAASAYCQHETGQAQREHVGHHVHEHAGEARKTPADGQSVADADCGSCHASGTAALPSHAGTTEFAATSMSAATPPARPFRSVPARAPDRPQWPRLV